MHHEIGLISTITVGLVYALIGGYIASRLRLPPLIGYLLAGIAVGPFTPGFVADAKLAPQLAEIGVILRMFGVGMHFSVRDLLAVRNVAVPGALLQLVVAAALTWGVARLWGWSIGCQPSPWLGALGGKYGCLTAGLGSAGHSGVAKRPDCSRLAHCRRPRYRLDSGAPAGFSRLTEPQPISGDSAGHDQGIGQLLLTLSIVLGKFAGFVLFMLLVGASLLRWLLERVAATRSRELFTLAVVVAAIGIGYGAAELFGLSFALGAFVAGVVVGESDHSHRAALGV